MAISDWISLSSVIVLTITLAVFIWYAYETQRLRKEAVIQTELIKMPIMSIYIRDIENVKDEEKRKTLKEKYAITHQVNGAIIPSPFYITLRNMGNGPAFNVNVENSNFFVKKYQSKFFAPEPKGDEHPIKIIKKPDNKIRDLKELEDQVFIVKCKSVTGKTYEYEYKIKNINEHIVEYLK